MRAAVIRPQDRSTEPVCLEENLALRPGVRIDVSVSQPTGGGARDPRILLNDTAHQPTGRSLADLAQGRTYDTFDGRNQTLGPDWYAIEFPEPAMFNCVEMTMGLPYRDGGWWTSLAIEVSAQAGQRWHKVDDLKITPSYNLEDNRDKRLPYQTHALTFSDVTAHAVRVIGRPGGLAQFTSLARLAVYHRDLSRWNPTCLPEPPLPYVFELISPQTIWDLSESLAKLTGLATAFPLLEYYLDETRYQQFWQRIRRGYEGEPPLWILVGDAVGWDAWGRVSAPALTDRPDSPEDPYVRRSFHDTLASAVAPVLVEGEIIGEMSTDPAILSDELDWEWHAQFAAEQGIPWVEYIAAVERTPHMTSEQMDGAAMLMGMIANTIANLAHHNRHLRSELDEARRAIGQRSQQRKELIRRAIDFMESTLEAPVRVADVAREIGLNPSYFCTVFAEQTGHTPSDFLIELRIERAKEYLAHTRMSVMEVCVALGYSPSYFSRLFKQRTGCTPGQYALRLRAR